MSDLAIQTKTFIKNYGGGGDRTLDNLNWEHLLALFGCTILFTLLAWLVFERRDARVSGTDRWNMFAWMTMELWLSLSSINKQNLVDIRAAF
ncbi:MAG TPA: hypothetical protein VF359_04370 [Anaerolineales bacterium]